MSAISEAFSQYVMPTYGRYPIAPVRGEGAWLWDDSGKRYLDFAAGVAVNSLGHCHPAQVGAIRAQAGTLIHCSNLYEVPGQLELARVLVDEVAGIPGKVFFGNSGAEVNDGLVKLARKFGHAAPAADGSPRFEVLTFDKSFHGRTLGGIAATGQAKVRAGFDPMLPGFRHLPLNDLDALREAIRPETAAILLEPLQGEGGINAFGAEFLRGVAVLCREHNLLLMLDEVQCGIGRAGALAGWRMTAPEIEPDAISWAKGMGGGFPIGAFWASARPVAPGSETRLCDVLGPGTHGSTYGGNPLACAASLAVVREIIDRDLSANAREIGGYIKAQVAAWALPAIREVRGTGLMLGFALDASALAPAAGFDPAHDAASLYVMRQLTEAGLLTVAAGPEVVRFLPPLNITRDLAGEALAIFKATLERLSKAEAA
ncbi:MAG: aspartate aminotransferase family protein [Verrucomicrobiales bacterium]